MIMTRNPRPYYCSVIISIRRVSAHLSQSISSERLLILVDRRARAVDSGREDATCIDWVSCSGERFTGREYASVTGVEDPLPLWLASCGITTCPLGE